MFGIFDDPILIIIRCGDEPLQFLKLLLVQVLFVFAE
jgi:hypothetical protein